MDDSAHVICNRCVPLARATKQAINLKDTDRKDTYAARYSRTIYVSERGRSGRFIYRLLERRLSGRRTPRFILAGGTESLARDVGATS